MATSNSLEVHGLHGEVDPGWSPDTRRQAENLPEHPACPLGT